MSNMQTVTFLTLVFLCYCVYTDLKYQRIFNRVTVPMLILGLIYHSLISGVKGLQYSGGGILIMMPLVILFVLGMLGAGDIKLYMALGAWYGKEGILWLVFYSLVVGGITAIVIMSQRNNFSHRMKYFLEYVISIVLLGKLTPYHGLEEESDATFRFAPAIAVGVLIYGVIGRIEF